MSVAIVARWTVALTAAAPQQQNGLLHACPGRLQYCGHRHTAGIGESLEVDHVFAQRHDKGNAKECSGNTAERQQHRVETIAVAEHKNSGHGEHHSRGGAVHAASDCLHDIVFNNALATEHAAQDSETKDRGKLGALDGEPEYQCGIPNRYGNDATQEPADDGRRPGQFRVRSP